ncbi:hypothetical protein ACH5RR_031289 [Cinchona calisaya]|uniref:Uncharacterized protein n=1 Tax=Cinchona calisaya TaxID=153742 RepID=A0ABD2YJ65_9GENT
MNNELSGDSMMVDGELYTKPEKAGCAAKKVVDAWEHNNQQTRMQERDKENKGKTRAWKSLEETSKRKQNQKVKELIKDEKLDWEIIDVLLEKKNRERITNIPLSMFKKKDVLYWCHSTTGDYIAKSGYQVQTNLKKEPRRDTEGGENSKSGFTHSKQDDQSERRESTKKLYDSVTEQSDNSSVTQDDPTPSTLLWLYNPLHPSGWKKGYFQFIYIVGPRTLKGGEQEL